MVAACLYSRSRRRFSNPPMWRPMWRMMRRKLRGPRCWNRNVRSVFKRGYGWCERGERKLASEFLNRVNRVFDGREEQRLHSRRTSAVIALAT
jgi:hypothetical protein